MYIHAGEIETLVRDLCIKAATALPGDVALALLAASRKETSPLGREILGAILKNAEFAKEKGIPICQDTGLTYAFLEIGREVHFEVDIKEAVT